MKTVEIHGDFRHFLREAADNLSPPALFLSGRGIHGQRQIA
jgi:hypothetical protein